VYVPAIVVLTQFGESSSVAHVVVVVPGFVSCADQLPE
jgi:hypothetical protein